MNSEPKKLGDTVYYWDKDAKLAREGIIYLDAHSPDSTNGNYFCYIAFDDMLGKTFVKALAKDVHIHREDFDCEGPACCGPICDSAVETEKRKLPGSFDEVYFISHDFIRCGTYHGRNVYNDACVSTGGESRGRSVKFETLFFSSLDAENELAKRKNASEMDFTTEEEEEEEEETETREIPNVGDTAYVIHNKKIEEGTYHGVYGARISYDDLDGRLHKVEFCGMFKAIKNEDLFFSSLDAENELAKRKDRIFGYNDEVWYVLNKEVLIGLVESVGLKIEIDSLRWGDDDVEENLCNVFIFPSAVFHYHCDAQAYLDGLIGKETEDDDEEWRDKEFKVGDEVYLIGRGAVQFGSIRKILDDTIKPKFVIWVCREARIPKNWFETVERVFGTYDEAETFLGKHSKPDKKWISELKVGDEAYYYDEEEDEFKKGPILNIEDGRIDIEPEDDFGARGLGRTLEESRDSMIRILSNQIRDEYEIYKKVHDGD